VDKFWDGTWRFPLKLWQHMANNMEDFYAYTEPHLRPQYIDTSAKSQGDDSPAFLKGGSTGISFVKALEFFRSAALNPTLTRYIVQIDHYASLSLRYTENP
jgi:hypothetical protein